MMDLSIEQAIDQFRRAAIEKAGLAKPLSRDHALHAAMSRAWRELEKHGESGRGAFKSLLLDESPHVRIWVASQLLALGDESTVPVLEALVSGGDESKFDADVVLREWRAGRLGPPFGGCSA